MCTENSSIEMFMFFVLLEKTPRKCHRVQLEIFQESVTEMPIFYNYALRCKLIKRFSSLVNYGGRHLKFINLLTIKIFVRL